MMNAKPFLKWAGGKTQLIKDINIALPKDVFNKDKFTYVEPFVGSGAVLFWMINNFPNLNKAIINDINSDLINSYNTIGTNPNELISVLDQLEKEFHELTENQELKKEYYYSIREKYNTRSSTNSDQAALFIFLNRTCFNGLYRVNSKNKFNVPMGSYKRPKICDKDNIMAVNKALQNIEILNGDYTDTLNHTDENSFFYFDPPYKPLSDTSSFNSYAKDEFGDKEQIRLGEFCKKLNTLGHSWMLSNSDVKGKNPEDNFFDELYVEFKIKRVKAKRMINANATKRGQLNELLITNYDYEQALHFA